MRTPRPGSGWSRERIARRAARDAYLLHEQLDNSATCLALAGPRPKRASGRASARCYGAGTRPAREAWRREGSGPLGV